MWNNTMKIDLYKNKIHHRIGLYHKWYRKKFHSTRDVIENGVEIFTEFADIYGDTIYTHETLEAFMKDFMEETEGSVIVDMLDTDNWDCIREYKVDHEKNLLYLYWQLLTENDDLNLMRKMVFPIDTYGMVLSFNNIQFIRDKKGKCYAICFNGSTIQDAAIKKMTRNFDPKKSRVVSDQSFFSTDYIRIDNVSSEDMRIMKTPIKSFWVIPKSLNVNPQDSQKWLYLLNLSECQDLLEEAFADLNKELKRNQANHDKQDIAIKTAGNKIRQVNENLFKLMMCYYQKDYGFAPKSYNDRLLSDAINPIKKNVYTTNEDKEKLNKIETVSNRCSHYTGLPVSIIDLADLYFWTKYYIEDFKFKIKLRKNAKVVDSITNSKPSPKDFLNESLKSFDFSNSVLSFKKATLGNMSFLIEIKKAGTITFLNKEKDYLCNDGKIHTLKEDDLSKALRFWNRSEVVSAEKCIEEYISKICSDNGLDNEKLWRYIDIKIQPFYEGKPQRLFSEQDVKNVMAAGDNNKNNRLVIDENGFPQLITDIDNGHLYPVYQEAWGGGEDAVGPESSLDQCHESYVACLHGFLDYLETFSTIYIDTYFDDSDIDEVKSKILNIING